MSSEPFHLTPEQRAQFERDGCLVIRNFFSKEEANALHQRALEMLRDFDLSSHPMTIFHTNEDEKHIGDDYFLNSGDKIRFFFEKDAFNEDGSLNRPKELAINKIGHDLALDPLFDSFTFSEDVKSLARDLNYHRDPLAVQTMVITKQPEIGGSVGIHSDSPFLYTTPLSALGLWFALENATIENGCLSFVPGSHKLNPIDHRLERVEGGGTAIKPVDVQDCDKHKKSNIDWTAEDVEWVSLECEAGDLVLIDGSVIHRSEQNKSDRSRFCYTYHMIDSVAEWSKTNWLQPTAARPFRRVFA